MCACIQVCAKAGLEPSAVDYIEAHGTGTVAGDGQELGALEEWYGRTGGRTAENPLLIGSVKSNMGHCEGCSGLAGVCALALLLPHICRVPSLSISVLFMLPAVLYRLPMICADGIVRNITAIVQTRM